MAEPESGGGHIRGSVLSIWRKFYEQKRDEQIHDNSKGRPAIQEGKKEEKADAKAKSSNTTTASTCSSDGYGYAGLSSSSSGGGYSGQMSLETLLRKSEETEGEEQYIVPKEKQKGKEEADKANAREYGDASEALESTLNYFEQREKQQKLLQQQRKQQQQQQNSSNSTSSSSSDSSFSLTSSSSSSNTLLTPRNNNNNDATELLLYDEPFAEEEPVTEQAEEEEEEEEEESDEERTEREKERREQTRRLKSQGRGGPRERRSSIINAKGYRELDASDIDIVEARPIGEGAFGTVHVGVWRGVKCAIKQLSNKDPDGYIMEQFYKEAAIMQQVSFHPNVVQFFGVTTLGKKMAIVSEFADKGSVYDLLIRPKGSLQVACNGNKFGLRRSSFVGPQLNKKDIIKIVRDAACGILHLHSEGIIHRDIAARNVLVSQHNVGMISDFGLSRVMNGLVDPFSPEAAYNSSGKNIGAVKYMAPESIINKTFSVKSDAWSFGVFLWEVCTLSMPWQGVGIREAALGIVKEGWKLPIPKDCDPVLAELMNKYLSLSLSLTLSST
ncbi:Tyrosine-protein kinase transmembrane receptor ror2, variant 2 [Balamuthia mandrillaris]